MQFAGESISDEGIIHVPCSLCHPRRPGAQSVAGENGIQAARCAGDKGVAGRRERYAAVETFNFTHSENKIYSDELSVGRAV